MMFDLGKEKKVSPLCGFLSLLIKYFSTIVSVLCTF
jgi:hypothetical protein